MKAHQFLDNDTICAPASAKGIAAIAVLRISGPQSFDILNTVFKPKKKNLNIFDAPSHTIHYGNIIANGHILDDVLVSVFRAPHSYTGENSVEISCHGSIYIQQRLLELLLEKGCRLAKPGEFTFRAFINGKFDLSQAEAVADLISSQSKMAHDISASQLRGGFSKKINILRNRLIEFLALVELELDFSEEDVEFADKKQLHLLISSIHEELNNLLKSFALGNVIKRGIPVAIVGKPNVGKSTLLNVLLNEERALVSSIPGTTRDAIEDVFVFEGISFRFIDTAGLRVSDDEIEKMGIERTLEKIKEAEIVLYVFDITETTENELDEKITEIKNVFNTDNKALILIGNKSDMLTETPHIFKKLVANDTLFISAKRQENINLIVEKLVDHAQNITKQAEGIVVSNVRHYHALKNAIHIIKDIHLLLEQNVSLELLAADMRRAMYYLDEITGLKINNEQVLDDIFANFCIGK